MIGWTRAVSPILFLCWFIVGCQSSGDSRQATSSDFELLPVKDSFSLRKLESGTTTDATKLFQSTAALQPDQTNPITPCGDGDFSMRELAVKSVSMSYQEVDSAIDVLSAMGYTTRVVGGERNNVVAGERFYCENLPVVMLDAEPDDSKLTFFPEGSDAIASQSNPYEDGAAVANLNRISRSHSGDIDRLMVFYHPDEPQALSQLEDHIRYIVDAPAPQVYIEGWVLEVSEEDSRELGIRYSENIGSDGLISAGNLTGDGGDTIEFRRDNRIDVDGNFLFNPAIGVLAQVRALVESGKAEILSRPSLLTMSNRQAVIQIVDVIQYPEIETTYQGLSNVTSGIRFGSLNVGITLNLRPKVSADRNWVSLEVDATVDAEDEENTGLAYQASPTSPGDRVVIAEKPGFSSRRVRTFARIPDRTPIIIGGLVSKEESKVKQRVPFLGAIPGIGGLFGFTDTDVTQREIMIVLTPHILAEDATSVRSNTPKDSSLFDDADLSLFSNRYRLRGEDIFDLDQITNDPNFLRSQFAARQAVHENPELINSTHYASFLNGDIPGGEALVGRTFFDLAQKLHLDSKLDYEAVQIKVLDGDRLTRVTLKDVLDQAGEMPIVISIDAASATGVFAQVGSHGVTPTDGSVHINGAADAERFVKAVIAREMIALNGGLNNLKIRHIQAGQFIDLPNMESGEQLNIDAKTLFIYESSSRYEQIVKSRMDEAYRHVGGDWKAEVISDGI